jgi:hypothetical protein
MKAFSIDDGDPITAFAPAADAKQTATEGAWLLHTEAELTAATSDWFWHEIRRHRFSFRCFARQEVHEQGRGRAVHLESDPAPACPLDLYAEGAVRDRATIAAHRSGTAEVTVS